MGEAPDLAWDNPRLNEWIEALCTIRNPAITGTVIDTMARWLTAQGIDAPTLDTPAPM